MAHFLLYLSFCRLLNFSQKLNVTFQGFLNIQSGHTITAELFKFVFFENYQRFSVSIETSAQIIYGNVTQG